MKRTKSLVSLLLLLLSTATLHSQFIKGVGITAGVAISNFRVTDVTPVNVAGQPMFLDFIQDNTASPSVSVFASLLNEEHLGLQTDLTYLRKGASRTQELPVRTTEQPEGNGTVEKITDEISFQCLEFALAAQPKQPVGDVILHAHVAPTASYLLSSANFFPLDELNRFRLGYSLGIGADFARVFDSNLLIEIRYAGDLRPFYEHPNARLWSRSWIFCIGTTL